MGKIKYCCRNFKKTDSKDCYKRIKSEHPDWEQKKSDCIGNCKMCAKQCIVTVGKKQVLCASSADELYTEISRLLGKSG